MTVPILPLPIPEDAPDTAAILASLQTPHADESVNLGGVAAAPDPGSETDAEKLARAKPGRKRSPVSKHRTKPELLATAKELEAENVQLRARLGEGGSNATAPGGPGPLGMSTAEVDRSMQIALDQTLELASNIAAAYYGPQMLIPKDERDIVRDAWAPIVRYYAPKMGTALPWVAALSATAMVVLPRVNAAREARQTQKLAQVAEPKTDTTKGATVSGQPVTVDVKTDATAPLTLATPGPRGRAAPPAERLAYTGDAAVAPPSRVITKDGTEQKPHG